MRALDWTDDNIKRACRPFRTQVTQNSKSRCFERDFCHCIDGTNKLMAEATVTKLNELGKPPITRPPEVPFSFEVYFDE